MINQNLKNYKISYNSQIIAKIFQELGQTQKVKENEKIFNYNKFKFPWQNKNEMYFLLDGKITIQNINNELFNIEAGEIFGSFTRYTSDNSIAIAHLSSNLIVLNEQQLLIAIKKYPEFILMIMDFLLSHIKNPQTDNSQIKHTEKTTKTNNKTSNKLSEKILVQLIEIIGDREIISIPAKQTIFQEGSNALLMYVILNGNTIIKINNKLIWRGERGDVIGEIALIDKCKRTASLIAETNCSLLSINQQNFINLIQSLPIFGLALLKILASRSYLPRTKEDYNYNDHISEIIIEEINDDVVDPKNSETWKII